jgi:choline transport protein
MATLAELVSMAPTSGGQYHWVSMLAPPPAQKFLGYMTGWLTLTGWQETLASAGLLAGTMIQNLVALSRPEYQARMQNWHGTSMLWAVLLLNYGINTAFNSLLVKFEGLAFVLHILFFFAIILPLVILGEHASPGEVFNSFSISGTGRPRGYLFVSES